MFLKRLKLTNFRNFEKLDLEFGPATLLIGKNAQGKSSLLEAIYFLATTKSSKVAKDSQLISQGAEICRVEGEVEGSDVTNLEIAMQLIDDQLGKRLKVNGVPRRALDYLGNLSVVLFSPEDIALVIGPPALRRWHLDLTLATVDREYKRAISEYSEVITSRNRVLKKIKEGQAKLNELDYWTERALESGAVITAKRTHFFNFLNSAEKKLGDYVYDYQPNLISEDRLREYLHREVAATVSLIGPHRDDFSFKLALRDLAYFGSRGEQRTAVLDLKLLELEYIYHLQGVKPILLLDDIFSELDEERRNHVISVVANQQTILSAVDTEVLPPELMKMVTQLRVEKGGVKQV